MIVKIAILLVLCIHSTIVSAIRPIKNPFNVKGRVYCDPCRVGFETPATTYIAGAEVNLQCKDRITNEIVFNKKAESDSSGSYSILVDEKQANQICDVRLVSNPLHDCKEATPGRDQSRIILNRFNGIATNERFVNNMGFMKTRVASGCAKILGTLKSSIMGNNFTEIYHVSN
ncbi:protein DOWNSTREAM OF FLC-like [Abrus precatorius]|uniref:Protein DOWNSTREAM OF FLC-like n=1 Tax=Abrus precatorius TaxID=3816 RepID=A0A8B8MMC3_ABRPR|nr:protein DOWNSTREAM OF FLC-like [Abrus precatorius]